MHYIISQSFSPTTQEPLVDNPELSASAAAAVEAVAVAAFKALAHRTSKRAVGERHQAWQLAQHILLRSILAVSFHATRLLRAASRRANARCCRVQAFPRALWDGWSRLPLR
jgi:hypothetical protein